MTKNILISLAYSSNLKANLYEEIRTSNMFDAELIAVYIVKKNTTKEKKSHRILSKTISLRNLLKSKLKFCKTPNLLGYLSYLIDPLCVKSS